MRGFILAAGLGLLAGSAAAANPFEYAPEARAFLSIDFGRSHARDARVMDLRYGLRLDHDARYLEVPLPAILELQFNRTGFDTARLNGLDVVRRIAPLRQVDLGDLADEEAVEEDAEEGASDEGETDQGGETYYTFVDWGVLALGVVGLGLVAMEVFDTEERQAAPAAAPPPAEDECLLPVIPICIR